MNLKNNSSTNNMRYYIRDYLVCGFCSSSSILKKYASQIGPDSISRYKVWQHIFCWVQQQQLSQSLHNLHQATHSLSTAGIRFDQQEILQKFLTVTKFRNQVIPHVTFHYQNALQCTLFTTYWLDLMHIKTPISHSTLFPPFKFQIPLYQLQTHFCVCVCVCGGGGE